MGSVTVERRPSYYETNEIDIVNERHKNDSVSITEKTSTSYNIAFNAADRQADPWSGRGISGK